MNRPVTSTDIEWLKNSRQIEVQDKMTSQVNSTKHLEKH